MGAAILAASLAGCGSKDDKQKPSKQSMRDGQTPRVRPLRIKNSCWARPPGSRMPTTENELLTVGAGDLGLHVVLAKSRSDSESGWVSLIDLVCKYHWTDGGPSVPRFMRWVDSPSDRARSWGCDYTAVELQDLARRLSGGPSGVITRFPIGVPTAEQWFGRYDVELADRHLVVSQGALPGLPAGAGVDVSQNFTGVLTVVCPQDVSAWATAADEGAVYDAKMKDCIVRVENPSSHDSVEGRCVGTTEVPGVFVNEENE